jgi:prolyl oligopeptidase
MFDADRPEPCDWTVVISDLPPDMYDCAIWNDNICITRSVNQSYVTTVHSLAGVVLNEIRYPEGGTLHFYRARGPAQKGIYYKYSSFTCPPVLKQYDLDSQSHRTIFQENVPHTPNYIEKRETTYVSADGSSVPICVAWDPERVLPSPGPLVFTAYGGFGVNVTPAYSTFVTFLLQQGFRFAFANVRGGSELGTTWYLKGRRKNKPNTISDFIAGAEWLVASGFTTPKHLAIFGGSNAGLVVAAAMTKRPDLFRAVICLSSILDMLRYHKFDLAYRWIEEYGSSDDPGDFPILLSYSPYHSIQRDAIYPAALFVSGEADDRCNPLHIRKMSARLLEESAGCSPVLVDISHVRGHSPTMSLTTRIDSLSDRLAFICDELHIEIQEPNFAGASVAPNSLETKKDEARP